MIVVEGPDGAGKSTLIQAIVERFGFPIAPRVVSKDAEAMVDLKAWTESNVSQGFHTRVYDRHRLISEPIYGSILRSRFEPGFSSVVWLNAMYTQFYMRCAPILIYCIPPYDTVRENLKNDADNAVVAPKIRRIYAQYVAKAASDAAQVGAFVHDYTYEGSTENALEYIANQLNRRGIALAKKD